MRLLPSIRYGTESYPEKVARRLRAVNLATWFSGAVTACFAVVQFLDPTPGVWKPATTNAVATAIFAAVPLLHRFGPLVGPVTLLVAAYAYLFVMLCLTGTSTGMEWYYLVAVGLTLLFFGAERVLLAGFFGVLAWGLVVALHVLVPYDTGLHPPAVLFASFVATVAVSCFLLMTVVSFALREAARAEEEVARKHELLQEKSQQLEMANKYKSHFLGEP